MRGRQVIHDTRILGVAAEPAPRSTRPAVEPDDPLLVLYTSGTTGFPKGAMLSRRNFVSHGMAVGDILESGSDDRTLVVLPLFHVAASTLVLRSIHAGLPTTLSRDATPASMFPALAKGATHAFLVPALIAGLLDAGDAAIKALSGLRWIGYGASPMPVPTLRAAMAAWPQAHFMQIYGMTELTGVVLALDDAAHRDASRGAARR